MTEVSIARSDLIPRWKPQRFLGLSEVGLREEPRRVGSKSVLSKNTKGGPFYDFSKDQALVLSRY